MSDLIDGQWELDGLMLGEDTVYTVTSFEDGGNAERRTEDTANAGDDGISFGDDLFSGMSMSWNVLVETVPADVWDAVRALRRTWRGDTVRRVPGAVTFVRVKRPGGPTLRAYGRPGNCTPVLSKGSGVGIVPVVADFRCSDDRYHADEARDEVVTLTASEGGGFRIPSTLPAVAAGAVQTSHHVTNDGDLPAWPVVTFEAKNGPMMNPSVSLLDDDGGALWTVAFSYTLLPGQSITVDTRPWVRTVLRENGASVAGARTRASSAPNLCTVPPGTSAVRFTATDTSGTGTATITTRDAYSAQ